MNAPVQKTEWFQSLCLNAGTELGVANAEAFGKSGVTQLEGIDIGLYCDPDMTALRCYIDLGGVEPELRAHVYERLLVMNTELDDSRCGMLGLDAESGHVLLHIEIRVTPDFDAMGLAQRLRHYTKFALEFRATLNGMVQQEFDPLHDVLLGKLA